MNWLSIAGRLRTKQFRDSTRSTQTKVRAGALWRLIGAAGLAVILVSCTDATAPTERRHVQVQGPQRDYGIVDWYDCTSWDGGTSWTCEYRGTTGGSTGPTYVNSTPAEVDHSTTNCAGVPGYCSNLLNGGGSGSQGDPTNNPVEPPPSMRDINALCLTTGVCVPPDEGNREAGCSDPDLAEFCDASNEDPGGPKAFAGVKYDLRTCPAKTTFTTRGYWAGEPAIYNVAVKKIKDLGDVPGLSGMAVYWFYFSVNGTRRYLSLAQVDCSDGSYIGIAVPRPQ
jgi:hypothetical protein